MLIGDHKQIIRMNESHAGEISSRGMGFFVVLQNHAILPREKIRFLRHFTRIFAGLRIIY